MGLFELWNKNFTLLWWKENKYENTRYKQTTYNYTNIITQI